MKDTEPKGGSPEKPKGEKKPKDAKGKNPWAKPKKPKSSYMEMYRGITGQDKCMLVFGGLG